MRCDIRLFLLASLFCIFFLSALSSILVQSSFSLRLYFSLTFRSAMIHQSIGHIRRGFCNWEEKGRKKKSEISKMSEMSEISVRRPELFCRPRGES